MLVRFKNQRVTASGEVNGERGGRGEVTYHVWRDVIWVLVQRRPTKCALKYTDGAKSEARANLDEIRLRVNVLGSLSQLAFLLPGNLVVAEPDAAVENGEGKHVVYKWLALRMRVRRSKCLHDKSTVSDHGQRTCERVHE